MELVPFTLEETEPWWWRELLTGLASAVATVVLWMKSTAELLSHYRHQGRGEPFRPVNADAFLVFCDRCAPTAHAAVC